MSSKIDLDRIRTIAESYSPQEMFAALVWQRQFNDFDGKQIIADLSERKDLWHSFLFAKGVYASPDTEGLSFANLADTLLAMANYRPLPKTSGIQFIQGNRIKILSQNMPELDKI